MNYFLLTISFNDMNIKDIHNISELFGNPEKPSENAYSWVINEDEPDMMTYLNVYTDIKRNDTGKNQALVSIISSTGYYELHNCNKVVIFEPDEVIFLSEENNRVSSITVRQSGSVSVFSNIDTTLMQQDVADLDPALVMAFTQLAIFEAKNKE